MNSITLTTTDAKVGLLRMGELMAGQFDRYGNNSTYWTLTPYSVSNMRYVNNNGDASNSSLAYMSSVKPSFNIKSNVVITGGNGTKEQPFTLS